MANTVTFALRMPPAIKEAAKALTKLGSLNERVPAEGVRLSRMNDALVYLLREGLIRTQELLDQHRARRAAHYEAVGVVMEFFMRNPDAGHARPDNFKPGSPARAYVEADMEAHAIMNPEDAWPGLSREIAEEDYHAAQGSLFALAEVEGTIQKAIVFGR